MNMHIDQLFKVAIYLRLSKEDGDLSDSQSGKRESESINNQRELILGYLARHPEMEIVGEYKDDGYTGTNFDRPGFKRMMDDIRLGAVNCVVVKDLSRFGRDYIECGKYMDVIFPKLGVRFIAMNEGIDSFKEKDNLSGPLKNMVNDGYSRDISAKVKSHLISKRKKGDFIGSFAVYGYKRADDDKNLLVIDEEAAKVIRDIFRWKIDDGLSPGAIAARLNSMGVLSPGEYKKRMGCRLYTPTKGTQALWGDIAVRRILQNEMYVGVMVQGKVMTPNYKTKKFITKDKSEWTRVEGTHEPIISRANFVLAQELLMEDSRASDPCKGVSPYAGKLYCGYCGSPLAKKTVSSNGKKYNYYVCKANKLDKKKCSKHSIREDRLETAVLATIKTHIEAALSLQILFDERFARAWQTSQLGRIDNNIAVQEEIIRKNNILRLGAYEDLQRGLIDKDEYRTLREELIARITDAVSAVDELNAQRAQVAEGVPGRITWLEELCQFKEVSELSRRLVVHLVDKIQIFSNNEIEITFRYQDNVDTALRFLEEYQRNRVIVLPKMEVV